MLQHCGAMLPLLTALLKHIGKVQAGLNVVLFQCAQGRVRPAKAVTRQDAMEMMGVSKCSSLAPSSSALEPHSVTATVLALWEVKAIDVLNFTWHTNTMPGI